MKWFHDLVIPRYKNNDLIGALYDVLQSEENWVKDSERIKVVLFFQQGKLSLV